MRARALMLHREGFRGVEGFGSCAGAGHSPCQPGSMGQVCVAAALRKSASSSQPSPFALAGPPSRRLMVTVTLAFCSDYLKDACSKLGQVAAGASVLLRAVCVKGSACGALWAEGVLCVVLEGEPFDPKSPLKWTRRALQLDSKVKCLCTFTRTHTPTRMHFQAASMSPSEGLLASVGS